MKQFHFFGRPVLEPGRSSHSVDFTSALDSAASDDTTARDSALHAALRELAAFGAPISDAELAARMKVDVSAVREQVRLLCDGGFATRLPGGLVRASTRGRNLFPVGATTDV